MITLLLPLGHIFFTWGQNHLVICLLASLGSVRAKRMRASDTHLIAVVCLPSQIVLGDAPMIFLPRGLQQNL